MGRFAFGSYVSVVLALAGCPLLLAGCPGLGTAVPESVVPVDTSVEASDEPTWETHVEPIVAFHCVECHGEPSANGAPDSFRLDVYDSATEPGAFEMAEVLVGVAVDSSPIAMPPPSREPVAPDDAAVLTRWLELGAPRDPEALP